MSNTVGNAVSVAFVTPLVTVPPSQPIPTHPNNYFSKSLSQYRAQSSADPRSET